MKSRIVFFAVFLQFLFAASVSGQKYQNGTRLLKGAEVMSATPLQLDYVLEKLSDTAKITVNIHEGKTHLVLDDGSGKWREWWYFMGKWQPKGDAGAVENLQDRIGEIEQVIPKAEDHISDKNNPHAVNKTRVGLGNVDNTSDADKPVSTAVRTALDKKANISDIPTSLPANGGDAATVGGFGSSDMITGDQRGHGSIRPDDLIARGYPAKYGFGYADDGWPTLGPFISFGGLGNADKLQIQADYKKGNDFYFRTSDNDGGFHVNNPWRKVVIRLTEDAGWTEIKIWGGYVRYCRVNDVVMVYGSHSAQDVGNYILPEGFRPKYPVYALCVFNKDDQYDSSNCTFIPVNPDGTFGHGVTVERTFSYSVQFPVN